MERRKDHVRCITIVHPLHEIRKYREFSAFFRLLGIFVCENISGEEYGDSTDYTIIIPEGSEQSLDTELSDDLNAMEEVFSSGTIQTLLSIYKIFKVHELMRASYAIAYFFDAKEDYIYNRMLNSYDRFKNAWEDFHNLENEVDDTGALKYIWAAKSNCRRRMNELYTIIWDAIEEEWYPKGKEENSDLQKIRLDMKEELWKRQYFDYNDINEDICKILENAPDFYGAYAIRGFALELDDEHRFDSVSDLLTAVNYIGNRSYTSYLCYRIGKYYETIRGDHEEKWTYYQMSWERDPRNYRALYKLALKEQDSGNIERADEMWGQLIGILEKKKSLPSLQPIECAYLFKGYSNWGRLQIKKMDIVTAISCFKNAEKVFENRFNEDADKGFYPWMFGTNIVESVGSESEKEGNKESWEIYKEAARNKLKIKDVYNRLSSIAADAGMNDLYSEYYQLLLEEL